MRAIALFVVLTQQQPPFEWRPRMPRMLLRMYARENCALRPYRRQGVSLVTCVSQLPSHLID